MTSSSQVAPRSPSQEREKLATMSSKSTFKKKSFSFFGKKAKIESVQNEDINISGHSLCFSAPALEKRFLEARRFKFLGRLRFGSYFCAVIIPLLTAMQVGFKGDTDEKWGKVPLVLVFPSCVFFCSLAVIVFLEFFSKNTKYLACVCLIGQICAFLDTTLFGTDVSEKNVWVHFIFSLGITSSTGIRFLEAQFVSSVSSLVLIILAWNDADGKLASPGTSMSAVVLYAVLLGFLAWHWEFEERRDFVLTERLAQENVKVQMTMEMTGWFSGGAATLTQDATGVMNQNCHIDPKDVEIRQELGEGTYGSVYAALWKETKVAVKKLRLVGDTEKIMTNFGAEATLMAQLRHPNIVMFMGVMVDPEFVGVVMELCPKGSVYGIIHQKNLIVDWSLYLRMLLDAARGMHFLHRNSPPIVHRDLKSLNLLIDADWRCKVSDFGISKLRTIDQGSIPEEGDGNRGLVGTTIFLAPEIFEGEEHSDKSDVYSFGIILYEVLSREVPFSAISPEAVPFVVQSGKRPTDFNELSETNESLCRLSDLMKECWSTLPQDRPSFSSIISRLQELVANYIGKEPWEDHVVFPDRTLATNEAKDQGATFTIAEEDLTIGESIGKGVFGAVFKGSYYGTPVAIKKLFTSGMESDVLADFHKECSMMQQLRHPNIVLFMGWSNNPPNLLLVTELLVNGSFFDIYHKRKQPLRDRHLRLSVNITLDMARGLAYLHNHDPVIIHRDLKSQNIMLDEKMTTKIGDFGLSKVRDVSKTMSICGSPLWVAPEVLRGEKYGCSCDVYSFAVIVWEALAWSEPYPDMSSTDVMRGVACGSLRPVPPSFTPPELVSILKNCWSAKASSRPSFNQLVPMLEALKDNLDGTSTKE